MPRSKSSKIVRACTTRFLTLGPPKHENVAIYVVNRYIFMFIELRELFYSEAIRRHQLAFFLQIL